MEDMQDPDAKTRAHARGQMMNLNRQIAQLYGLNIPTKQEIEFSEKRHGHYADVIEAQVTEAKELLLAPENIAQAKATAKAKIKRGPNPATKYKKKYAAKKAKEEEENKP